MAVCDPSQNPPIPSGLRHLQDNEVTPEMQSWAASIANNLAWPIGDFSNRRWFTRGAFRIPIVAGVLCHSYTQQGEQRVAGAYHGVTLFQATSPEMFPQEIHPDTTESSRSTDWNLVGVGALTIAIVTGAFLYVVRATK